MPHAGNTLGFFGLSHNGGEIALLHRHTGKRWQLAARRLSDKPIVQICVSWAEDSKVASRFPVF